MIIFVQAALATWWPKKYTEILQRILKKSDAEVFLKILLNFEYNGYNLILLSKPKQTEQCQTEKNKT